MTTTTATSPTPNRIATAVRDGVVIGGRNLRAMSRVPEVIVFSTIQPVIFVLMFRYVFGGAIDVPGVDYVDFLMPGIFVQTVLFGGMNTVIGLSDDLGKGIVERFRSLPMARSAFLTGRVLADLVRNIGVVALMAAVGFAVGFRVHTGALPFLAAMGLVLLLSVAISWFFSLFSLSVRNAEAAQAATFPPMAVLVFASSAFVPVASMPGWLQAFANNQPVSANVDAIRALVLGGPTADVVVEAVAWSIGVILVTAPVAVRRYRRTS